MRTTISEMGPLLLSRLLELSDAQEGVINIAFRVADEEGMPLLDLKDLQALLVWIGENGGALSLRYGNVSSRSVGGLVTLSAAIPECTGTNNRKRHKMAKRIRLTYPERLPSATATTA